HGPPGSLHSFPTRRSSDLDDAEDVLPDEALISRLIEREVKTPDAGEDECQRYYAANAARFRSPDLFDAQHILFAAPPDDAAARADRKSTRLNSSHSQISYA